MAMHLQYIVATDDSLRPAGVVVFEICGDERYPITRHGTGLIDLFAYSLFNLADDVLNFSGVFFSNAISFQVGVLRELAGLLLDCAFDFVKIAGCLIFCARFHRDSLFCSVVVVDSLKSMDGYSHLDCLRPGKTLFE
jgi:hypothetical protein